MNWFLHDRYLRHETIKYEFWTYFLLHQCWGKKGFIKNVFFLFNVGLYCNNRNSSNIIVLREVLGAAWKVTKYGFISAPSFPLFGFNTEIYSVNLRIQSEYRKINKSEQEINPYLDTFHTVRESDFLSEIIFDL